MMDTMLAMYKMFVVGYIYGLIRVLLALNRTTKSYKMLAIISQNYYLELYFDDDDNVVDIGF